jgi:hypothetical protein
VLSHRLDFTGPPGVVLAFNRNRSTIGGARP